MGDFFHGWRRKVGCVTLVIACLFLAGWVRAQMVTDMICIHISPEYVHVIGSHHGSMFWTGRVSDGQEPVFSTIPKSIRIFEKLDFIHRSTILGFESSKAIVRQNGIEISYWVIPYWAIVIPPAAISAWLLLSKPRKEITKSLHPTEANGV